MRSIFSILLAIVAVTVSSPAQDMYDIATIRTFELTFKQANYWQQLETNYNKGIYIKADLTVDGKVYPDVGVRFRGNSSYWGLPSSSMKKPFKIATDEFVPGQKVKGYKTFNLNNNFVDPTMVREVLGYRILREFMPAPKCNYAWLKLNGQDWGLYINTQQINKDLLEEWFESKDGNRYRGERDNLGSNANNSALTYLGSNLNNYKTGYLLKSETSLNPWVDLEKATRILNNTATGQLPAALPSVLDVDNALWFLACSNTMLFLDNYVGRYCHNFHLYHDTHHDQLVVLPWDQNSAFGGYKDSGLSNSTLHQLTPYYYYRGSQRPLMTKLIAVPEWKARYDHHVRTIVDKQFNWANLGPQITALQSSIDALVRADPNSIYSYQFFKDGLTKTIRLSFWATLPGLQPIITGREGYLKGHASVGLTEPVITGLTHSPAVVMPNASSFVTAAFGGSVGLVSPTLYYRAKGPFLLAPMFDDGMHGDGAAGDGVYGGTVPGQIPGSRVEYYVGVSASAANSSSMAFEPSTAGHRPPSFRVGYPTRKTDLSINEFLAKNEKGIKDPAGEREDWIELHNSGTSSLPVDGMYVTDDLTKPTKFILPAGAAVPAGGVLLVWADEDGAQGVMHANFKLSSKGEELALFDRDGITMLDYIEFGAQEEDVSSGRIVDGGRPWVTLAMPTPHVVNVPVGTALRDYSAFDASKQSISLHGVGLPTLGSVLSLEVRDGPVSTAHTVLAAFGPAHLPLPLSSSVLLGSVPLYNLLSGVSDGNGALDLALFVPNDPNLVGAKLYLQAWAIDQGAILGSSAVELRF